MPRPADPHAREALLRAARSEFARHGIDRARVGDIAQKAGLSKGAFYLHFASKQDAFREMVQRFIGVLEEHAARRKEALRRLQDELQGAEPGRARAAGFEGECALDVEVLDALWRNREVLSVLDGASAEPHRPLVSAFRQRLRDMLIGDVAERQAEGGLRADLDPEAVADAVFGVYETFGHRMAGLREKPDLGGWARTIRTILYEGLLPPAGCTVPAHTQDVSRRRGD